MPNTAASGEAGPFIVTTPARQSIEEKRMLIRRHVMRGKNRKKLPVKPPSWINGGELSQRPPENEHLVAIPAKVGGEFSFTALSAALGAETVETIWRRGLTAWFWLHLEGAPSLANWAIVKHVTSPAGLDVARNQPEYSWFEPMWKDDACLHFSIFVARRYLDFVHGQVDTSENALAHCVKALNILQQRLAGSDHELSISDSTIVVVVGLAITAVFLGDFEAAVNHLGGLRRMVALRGGISAMRSNRNLQSKICRAELQVALATGCKPLFFPDCGVWSPYIALQRSERTTRAKKTDSDGNGDDRFDRTLDPEVRPSDLGLFISRLDTRLRLVWSDVSEFIRGADIASQCNLHIDVELSHELMVSVHYRLVNLRFDSGHANETVRLALLAFVSSIFLQWRGIRARFTHLARSFRRELSLLSGHAEPVPAKVSLWLYVVGAVAAFNEDENDSLRPAMTELLKETELRSWSDVRSSLKSVLWLDDIHGPTARRIIGAILSKH